ncbi:MAG: nitrate/nitrite transporter NrtS [Elainellaceae cyanobacterium]
MKDFFRSLADPKLAPSAIRVAIVVGSLLLTINHGAALINGKMTRSRWLSAGLTYLVPYMVNIHGQHTSRQRQNSPS